MIYITSRGIDKIPFLDAFTGADVTRNTWRSQRRSAEAVAGWGRRSSADKARRLAAQLSLPYWSLEDGFLRSYGTGERFPPLSMVIDKTGIYYDSTSPSALEDMLNGKGELLDGIEADVARARRLILQHRLSKYNNAPFLQDGVLRPHDDQRVLVVDQTAGDMSVALGGATAETFHAMLRCALSENAAATVYVKTHPEVSEGRKGGYLTRVQDDARTVVLRGKINPLSIIEQMDRVYVVSSTMGFEALLAGKPVTCLGLPWYAGWGSTDDRRHCPRRTRRRTVDELFAAAYFHYARYLDPVTHERGTIFDVIDWLAHQQEMTFGLSDKQVSTEQ